MNDRTMLRIFVATPYRGNVFRNRKLAQYACQFVMARGHAPLAPHLYLTEILDDSVDFERRRGMTVGAAWLDAADELWAWGSSDGVEAEIRKAERQGIPVQRFELRMLEEALERFQAVERGQRDPVLRLQAAPGARLADIRRE